MWLQYASGCRQSHRTQYQISQLCRAIASLDCRLAARRRHGGASGGAGEPEEGAGAAERGAGRAQAEHALQGQARAGHGDGRAGRDGPAAEPGPQRAVRPVQAPPGKATWSSTWPHLSHQWADVHLSSKMLAPAL